MSGDRALQSQVRKGSDRINKVRSLFMTFCEIRFGWTIAGCKTSSSNTAVTFLFILPNFSTKSLNPPSLRNLTAPHSTLPIEPLLIPELAPQPPVQVPQPYA